MIDDDGSFERQPLRPADYGLLLAGCLILFLLALTPGRVLSGHAAVVPVTSREMLANHQWLIPQISSQPWLERPPLSSWINAGVNALCGTATSDRVARLSAVVTAVPIVLMVSWMASVFYGRQIALLSGLIFATSSEFYFYAHNPESDIHLCLVITTVLTLFVRLEFGAGAERLRSNPTIESTSFWGNRPWDVWAFFVLLGLTNLAKGLFFGTVLALLPVGGYLLWNRRRRPIQRYVWCWGWLAFLAAAFAWPAYIIMRHPEMLRYWDAHYLGRLHRGYLREPIWYYALAVPGNLLPWTLPALVGLWMTRRPAWSRPTAERFLWFWALLPPLVFSIPHAKHHHYMLHSQAPLAILAALGTGQLWRLLFRLPTWARHPAWGLTLTPLVLVAAALWGHRLRAPVWIAPTWAVGLVVLTVLTIWCVTRRDSRWAVSGLFVILCVGYTAIDWHQAVFLDDYHHDVAFLRHVSTAAPTDRPLLALWDARELESFWLKFYGDPRIQLRTSARDIASAPGDVYVLARREDAPALEEIGAVEEVLASVRTRSEKQPTDRRVLFHVQPHQAPVQATGGAETREPAQPEQISRRSDPSTVR